MVVQEVKKQIFHIIQYLFPIFRFLTKPLKGYSSYLINVSKISYATQEKEGSVVGLQYFKELFPREEIKRNTIQGKSELHWKFNSNAVGLAHLSEPIFIFKLDNGRVISSQGAVLDSNQNLIAEVSREIGRSIEQHSLLKVVFFKQPLYLRGTSVTIAAPDAASNYFHWMFDVIPRYQWVMELGIIPESIDHWIVNSTQHTYQNDTLMEIGIDCSKIVDMKEKVHVMCDSLIVPSKTGLSGNISVRIVNILRDMFKSWMIEDGNFALEKIFISRQASVKRKVENYEMILPVLEKYGFEIITLEDKTVSEQIKIFYNSKFIVGVHGAGFTNIAFCKPGTVIVEIFPPNYVNQCYWTIASHNSLKYNYFLGEGDIIIDKVNHLIDSNVYIDLRKFENYLSCVVGDSLR